MKALCYAPRVVAILGLLSADQAAIAQGSLTPPGPPGPTMKTLTQVEPRTAVGLLPFAIQSPGSYYLTTNLTGSAGAHGITIEASHVTLDLNGFALAGHPGSLAGVQLSNGATNVLIRYGTITGWTTGVDARVASGCRFESLRSLNNLGDGLVAGPASALEGCTADANQGSGIRVDHSSTVQNCSARGNQLHGIVMELGSRMDACTGSSNLGSGLVASNNCVIARSVAINNGADGFTAGADVQISGSKGSNNGGSGLFMGADAVVSRCSASGNLDIGILAGTSAQIEECKAVANTRGIVVQAGSSVRGCNTLQNSGNGISVTTECVVSGNTATGNFLARDAAGVHVTGTDNCIKENTVLSNDWGIRVEVAGNLIIKNTAANNSLNYSINGSPQAMGPIVSGDRFTDTTNPVANLEF